MTDDRNRAKNRIRDLLDELRQFLRDSPNRKLSESDTKAYFVDPLLSALGFSTMLDITREYYVKDSREFVDYMLYVAGVPTMVVEAKQLQHILDARDAAQLVQYATVEGIEWSALTNGRRFQFYNTYLKAPVAGKLVADCDLQAFSTDEEYEALFDDLWMLSKVSLAMPEKISVWMNRRRVDAAILSVSPSTTARFVHATSEPGEANRPKGAAFKMKTNRADVRHFVQYHNTEKMGYPCTEIQEMDVFTNKPVSVSNGDQVWLVAGEGKNPRSYYLAYRFTVDDTGIASEHGFKYYVRGSTGTFFRPPIRMNGIPWWSEFLKSQSNFSLGLQAIRIEYVTQLESLERAYSGNVVIGQ